MVLGCCESRKRVDLKNPYDFNSRPNEKRVIQEFDAVQKAGNTDYKLKLIDRDVLKWKVAFVIAPPKVQSEIVAMLEISMSTFPEEAPPCVFTNAVEGFARAGSELRLFPLIGAWSRSFKMVDVLAAIARMFEVYSLYTLPMSLVQYKNVEGTGAAAVDQEEGFIHFNKWDPLDMPFIVQHRFVPPDLGFMNRDPIVHLQYKDYSGDVLHEFHLRSSDLVRDLEELLLNAGFSKYFRVHSRGGPVRVPDNAAATLGEALICDGDWLTQLDASGHMCTLVEEAHRFQFLDWLTECRETDKLAYIGVGNGGNRGRNEIMSISHQYYPPFFAELVKNLCGPNCRSHAWLVDSSFSAGGGDGSGGIEGAGPEIQELFQADVDRKKGDFAVDVYGTVFNLYAPLYRYITRLLERGGAVFICFFTGTSMPMDFSTVYTDLKVRYAGNFQVMVGAWFPMYKYPVSRWMQWMDEHRMVSDIVFALLDDRYAVTEKASKEALDFLTILTRNLERPGQLDWKLQTVNTPRLTSTVAILGCLFFNMVHEGGQLRLRGVTRKDEEVYPSLFPKAEPAGPSAEHTAALAVDKSMVGVTTTFTVVVKSTEGAVMTEGGHDVMARITAPIGNKLTATVVDEGTGEYTVSYVPTCAGDHEVIVLLNALPISNVPFKHAAAHGPVAVENCVATGDGLRTAVCNKPSTFTLESFDKYKNKRVNGSDEFTASLEKEGGASVPVKIVDEGRGQYTASYTPKKAGLHNLHINCGGLPIAGSPFSVAVVAVLDDSGTSVTSITNAIANQPVLATLVTRDNAGDNTYFANSKVAAKVLSPSSKSVPTSITDTKTGEYAIAFTPTEAGSHTLTVTLDGKSVGQAQGFSVAPGPVMAAQCVVSGDALRTATCNQEASFTLQSYDENKNKRVDGGDVFTGSLTRNVGAGPAVPVAFADQGRGDYRGSYTPTHAGPHTLQLQYGNTPVGGSPFAVDVAAVLDTAGSNVTRISSAQAHEPVTVTLTTRDSSGEPTWFPNANPDAKVTSPSGALVHTTVANKRTGEYDIVFTPVDVGAHSLTVYLDGVPVGAAQSFTVAQGPTAAKQSTAAGAGLKQANALLPAKFVIQAKDAQGKNKSSGGDSFKVVLSGRGKKANVRVVDVNDGTYAVAFAAPAQAGPYQMAITLTDEHISGSPFTTVVQSVPSPKFSVLSGLEPSAAIGDTHKLTLATRDDLNKTINVGGYEVTCHSVHPKSGSRSTHAVTDTHHGTYTVEVPYSEAGLVQVDVSVTGNPLQGSPFSVRVLGGGPDPEMSTVEGEGVFGGYLAKDVTFTIVARDPHGNQLPTGGIKWSVKLLDGPTKDVPIKVVDNDNGTYSVSYVGPAIGEYRLHVLTEDGVALKRSPFVSWIIPTEEESLIRKAFDHYDTSGDQSISDVEFAMLLDDVGAKTTFKTKIALYEEIDADHAGGISFSEFEVFYLKYWHNIPTRVKTEEEKADYEALEWTMEDEEMTRSAFEKYDKDGSNSINIQEFEWVLDDLGIVVCKRDREELFNAIEGHDNADGGISYEEFENWWFTFSGRKSAADMKAITQDGEKAADWNDALEESLKASFTKYDTSGDGVISFLEFGQLLEDMGARDLRATHLLGLYERIDTNGSGDITFDEFRGWWIVYQTTHKF